VRPVISDSPALSFFSKFRTGRLNFVALFFPLLAYDFIDHVLVQSTQGRLPAAILGSNIALTISPEVLERDG